MSESKIALAKEGQREVSSFFGSEMLFDYYEGNLDPNRRTAIDDYLRYSGDAQSELESLRRADEYMRSLASLRIKSETAQYLAQPKSYFQILQTKFNFTNWITGLRWGVEALLFVSVVIALFSLAPWESIIKRSLDQKFERVVLTEIPRPSAPIEPTASTSDFKDEGISFVAKKIQLPSYLFDLISYKPPEGFVPTQAPRPQATTVAVKSAMPSGPLESESAPMTIADNQVPAQNPKIAAQTESKNKSQSQTAPSDLDVSGGGGFLFRGDLPVTNLAAVGGKLKEKIELLGGRKAGEVELGWVKAKDRLYFHFTMPAAKYQELDQFLRNYGKLKIAKEKHPRVMPDGIVRLIIEVSEKTP
ncbi:MAG TPA: hypothetical protein PLU50_00865 [Pseudobdellovibrionaceae bacterium]|nr:hypothetical protein [Pseudobdellovibrionaceae bacterium]